jgi:gliding motility-associated protein GldM
MPVSSNPNSPRQKMINLMYLVFIALMALNVSSEVLKGFEVVQNSLRKTIENSSQRNDIAMRDIANFYELFPARGFAEYTKANNDKKESDAIFSYIEELKVRIVKETDGKKGDINNVKNKENLDAAARIMLAPVVGEGRKLRERLELFRTEMADLVGDPEKTKVIESILDMEISDSHGRNWETVLFDNMPVAAAITILTKLQSDVRYVEGEVLSSLQTDAIDVEAYRVNDIQAMVIPQSQIVMQGSPYRAQIVLAALDTTQKPEIFISGINDPLQDNWYTGSSATIGEHPFSGKMVLGAQEYDFKSSYFVTEQIAIIAPHLTNMLYESIENPFDVAIPGIPSGSVRASISAGNIKNVSGNVWSAIPPADAKSVTITLTGNVTGGNPISIAKEFRVRRLPPAQAYIEYKDASGAPQKFTSEGVLSRRSLLESEGVLASIDDGVLDIKYRVTGFQLRFVDSMGNFVPVNSQSSSFTPEQLNQIRNYPLGKQFFVTNITAIGPSGRVENIRGALAVTVR